MSGVGLGAAVIMIATLALSLAGLYLSPSLLQRCAFRPYWVTRRREYHTLITSGLMHADMPHLIFNGITFWFFAVPLERIIGTVPFLLLYVPGLLLSLVGSFVKHRNDPDYATLGASGAISAALFAAIVYMPTAKMLLLIFPVPMPAALYGVGYLVYCWWASRQPRADRINHDAHFAGALWGLLFVAVLDPGAYARAWDLVTG